MVSYNTYLQQIASLEQDVNNLASNYQNFAAATAAEIEAGLSSNVVYGKQIPANPSLSGAPTDVVLGDTLTIIVSKFQRYINTFKKADGISVTSGFVAGNKENLNNNDTVDSALRKAQAWINAFKLADETKLTVNFTPSNTPTIPNNTDTVDSALRKIQGFINILNNSVDNLNSEVPIGVIMMWSGSIVSIPAKYALCDGENGTPNLLNRFIVGAGSGYAPGANGGIDTVTLDVTQIPSHNHTQNEHNHTQNEHSHQVIAREDNAGTNDRILYNQTDISGTTNINGTTGTTATNNATTATNNATGGGLAHENRPPYYALAYIMKIA